MRRPPTICQEEEGNVATVIESDAVPAVVADTHRRRQPLARGIELLTLIVDSEQDVHGVRELAARLDVSPSTVHRLLTDLERAGLVARTPNGSYRLGLEFLRMAWTTAARHPLQDATLDLLRRLTDQTGESAFFCVYSEQRRQMMFALAVDSPHPLRYSVPLRTWLPMHAGASGLAILAFAPPEVQDDVAQMSLRHPTDRAPIDPETWQSRLEAVRADGYAFTSGDRIEGATAVAAPFFGTSGVAGSVGITVPAARFDTTDAHELGRVIKGSAEELSALLRFQRSPAPDGSAERPDGIV